MTEVQPLVDSLAAELGRPVGVDDRRFRAVAYSSHPDEVDQVRVASILHREAPETVRQWLQGLSIETAAAPIRLPANRELGMSARVCVPLRFDDALLGYLWLIDEPIVLGEGELEQALAYAEEIAIALHRSRRQDSEEEEHELVTRLLSADTGAGQDAPGHRLASARAYAVLAVVPAHPRHALSNEAVRAHLADAIDQVRRESHPGELVADLAAEPMVCVLACQSEGDAHRRGMKLHGVAARSLAQMPEWEVRICVSDEVPDRSDLPGAAEQVREAIWVAMETRMRGPLISWSDLGAFRLLAALLGQRDPGSFLPVSLRRLLAAADAEVLIETLERYLDLAGDARAAADQLFIHRSSLYGRLHKIEEIAGVDLRSGEDRLELHLGIRLWRLSGSAKAADDSGRA